MYKLKAYHTIQIGKLTPILVPKAIKLLMEINL